MSRAPAPGTLVEAIWEDDDNRLCSGLAAVMSTSRHTKSVTEAEALELLKAAHGESTTIARLATWHWVTKADRDGGFVVEGNDGDWDESASGASWVRVAYPVLAEP